MRREEPAGTAHNDKIIRTPRTLLQRALRAAAVVALMIGVMLVATTPLSIDEATLASLAPTVSRVTAEDLWPQAEADSHAQCAAEGCTCAETRATDTLTISAIRVGRSLSAIHVPAEVPASRNTATASKTPTARRIAPRPVMTEDPADGGRYYVVVASLASIAEAEKYMRKQADPTLQLLTGNGYIRVYSHSSDTRGEANQARAQAASRYPGAWVCRQ